VPNPKPKPPRVIDLESMCRAHTETSVRRLVGYARSKDVPDGVALRAIEILLERGWGRPKQVKEHTGAGGEGPIVVEIVYQRPPTTPTINKGSKKK
jgi:hypothetical protein